MGNAAALLCGPAAGCTAPTVQPAYCNIIKPSEERVSFPSFLGLGAFITPIKEAEGDDVI